MAVILFQKGATSWGFQIGRAYLNWPYLAFWKVGCRPTLGWEDDHG